VWRSHVKMARMKRRGGCGEGWMAVWPLPVASPRVCFASICLVPTYLPTHLPTYLSTLGYLLNRVRVLDVPVRSFEMLDGTLMLRHALLPKVPSSPASCFSLLDQGVRAGVTRLVACTVRYPSLAVCVSVLRRARLISNADLEIYIHVILELCAWRLPNRW